MGQNTSKPVRRKLSVASVATPTNDNLSLDGYRLLKKLGEGSYGRVIMVKQKKSGSLYALKYVDKRHTPAVLKTIVEERNVLGKLKHPFISNLRYAFQDEGFYFLVLDLGDSGDLRSHIAKYTFSEDTVRHWIAELACAVEYLHDNNIVHRDIKPENILLDSSGHLKLADFNVARELTPENPVINGVSGTFNYLAPEMHQGVPYSEKVDWWALGIVFFECIYNRVPFKVKIRSKMLSIMASPGLIFPESEPPVSNSCKAAIRQFLQFYPYDRLSSTNEVFDLEFFSVLDKYKLETGSNMKQTESYTMIDTGPIYKPASVIYKALQSAEDCACRDDLEKEYPIWHEKKMKNEEEKKRQQAAKLEQKKGHVDVKQVGVVNVKSNGRKRLSVTLSRTKAKVKNSKSREDCMFSMNKFKRIVIKYTTPKATSTNHTTHTKLRSRKSRNEIANTGNQDVNIKRLATIKYKYELQQSFVPFESRSSSGSATAVSTDIGIVNKPKSILNPVASPGAAGTTTLGSTSGGMTFASKQNNDLEEEECVIRPKEIVKDFSSERLPPGVLAVRQKGRTSVR